MDVSTLGISSLQGIEFFQHLEVLLCSYNNISSLDISTLTSLLTLACNKNNLSALDLSHQSELLHLQCSYNDIRSLDLSQNTELNSLFCDHNQITFLNLELNTSLREISCQSQTIKGISVYFNPDFELPYQINLTELVGTIYTSKIFRVRPSEDFSFTYDNNGLLHLSNTPRYVIYYYDTGLNDIDFFVKVYIEPYFTSESLTLMSLIALAFLLTLRNNLYGFPFLQALCLRDYLLILIPALSLALQFNIKEIFLCFLF